MRDTIQTTTDAPRHSQTTGCSCRRPLRATAKRKFDSLDRDGDGKLVFDEVVDYFMSLYDESEQEPGVTMQALVSGMSPLPEVLLLLLTRYFIGHLRRHPVPNGPAGSYLYEEVQGVRTRIRAALPQELKMSRAIL